MDPNEHDREPQIAAMISRTSREAAVYLRLSDADFFIRVNSCLFAVLSFLSREFSAEWV
jgi:hypothetical protein